MVSIMKLKLINMEQIRKNVFQIILIRNLFGDSDMIINQSLCWKSLLLLLVLNKFFLRIINNNSGHFIEIFFENIG